ncbi:tRNA-guanine transglycosylase [uncultured Draconibacterium sp.]|uniref:tRNA-guanine transglycosylase n=1 Tax=uncultured Draconibacterium sp. TaxID=1573823 RepID=UPI003260055E
MEHERFLDTQRGRIPFPAYIPVTTYGDSYPLDNLIRPYLPRLAPAVMVSYSFAQAMQELPSVPVLIDSGGFVSLFKNARTGERDGMGVTIVTKPDETEEVLDPMTVLEFQEEKADVAFTLDFPIPPGMEMPEARERQKLTIANAIWAVRNRRRKDLALYGCVQAWDPDSARACAEAYADHEFDGIAIGGMVPRSRDLGLVLAIVEAVRAVEPDKPLHVFGLGKPETVRELFAAGVDSIDSSAYLKAAADGKRWDTGQVIDGATSFERLEIALRNLSCATRPVLPLGWNQKSSA